MARAKQSKEEKAIDKEIDVLFRKNHQGVQIDIMDIPKLFAEARKARAEGRDMEAAINDFVKVRRRN